MSTYLIKIDKGKWHADEPWQGGDLQAAALWDLRQGDNKLSVWKLETGNTNLERIIACLSATRNTIENFDYVFLNEQSFENIEIEKCNGDTPDEDANRQWHYDFVRLTISKIVQIAYEIRRSSKSRVFKADVTKYLITSLDAGYLNKARVNEKVLKKVEDAKRKGAP